MRPKTDLEYLAAFTKEKSCRGINDIVCVRMASRPAHSYSTRQKDGTNKTEHTRAHTTIYLPVPLRERDETAAVSHEAVDVAVHPPRRGRAERTGSQPFGRLRRACNEKKKEEKHPGRNRTMNQHFQEITRKK